jgi:hypothetical protein
MLHGNCWLHVRGSFEKFVDWRQCSAVMPSCSGEGNVVVLKESFLGWRSNYEGRLKISWTHLITPFTFSRSGWSFVRSASLAKGSTSKKRPSPRLHKVPTQSNKASPRTFQNDPRCSATLKRALLKRP